VAKRQKHDLKLHQCFWIHKKWSKLRNIADTRSPAAITQHCGRN